MRLRDLEEGMYVELRDGFKGVVTSVEGMICEPQSGEIVDVLHWYEPNTLTHFDSSDCDVVKVYENYTLSKVLWERPIELNEVEKVLLDNMCHKFKWIARDIDDNLYIYKDEPFLDCGKWIASRGKKVEFPYHEDFKFIKVEDNTPYYIPKLIGLEQ